MDHSLSCSHGGYLGIRHNEVRDLLGHLLEETCSNVSLEPALQHLDGEDLPSSANTKQDARADLKASGFWSSNRHCCAFFDVRVFHPHAQSYRATPLPNIYRSQEREKRRQYEMRVREVDRGTFTPWFSLRLVGPPPQWAPSSSGWPASWPPRKTCPTP